MAERIRAIPAVLAVTLGESRARGDQRPDNDWDPGVYYRDDWTRTTCARWATR